MQSACVGEPGYPIATVTRGKKVIVGNNEKFHVADHDFTKLLLIPDAYHLHEIPESRDDLTAEESCDDIESGEKSHSGEWYVGQVFYGFKSMVNEGITAMWCAVELGELMIEQFETISLYLYVYSDVGPERKTDNLSVQKSFIALFLLHNFEEILIARTAANLYYCNPLEWVHAITNLGLQSVGLMRKAMPQNMENVIRNSNSNDEIRKLCSKNNDLEIELKKSLDQPKKLIEDVFKELSLKGKKNWDFSSSYSG